MTGPADAALGRDLRSVTGLFLTGMPAAFKIAENDAVLEGALIDVDERRPSARHPAGSRASVRPTRRLRPDRGTRTGGCGRWPAHAAHPPDAGGNVWSVWVEGEVSNLRRPRRATSTSRSRTRGADRRRAVPGLPAASAVRAARRTARSGVRRDHGLREGRQLPDPRPADGGVGAGRAAGPVRGAQREAPRGGAVDEARKKPIPMLPRHVGIVTSPPARRSGTSSTWSRGGSRTCTSCWRRSRCRGGRGPGDRRRNRPPERSGRTGRPDRGAGRRQPRGPVVLQRGNRGPRHSPLGGSP